ncbi:MAG: peptidylprolyl isomerase [Pseudomonadota bacterium]|nr:peptidylprolyl isomerase [Pseudomonadota bacterium]
MAAKIKSRAFLFLYSMSMVLLVTIGLGAEYSTAAAIGSAKKVVNKVFGGSLTRSIRAGEKVNANQRIRTGRDSAADILFVDDTTLFVGELSHIVLDELVYDGNASHVTGSIELMKGILRFASASSGKVDLSIKTSHGGFGIRGTAFDLLTNSRATEIAVHEGEVTVKTPFGIAIAGAGKVYRVTAASAEVLPEITPLMKETVGKMLGLLDTMEVESMRPKEKTKKAQGQNSINLQTRIMAKTIAARSQDAAALKNAIANKNPADLIYLDTTAGLLVIETLPKLAPNHVERVKNLVRARFYDGLLFHNVVANFAAETGDPSGTGAGGSGRRIKAEFSDTKFVSGTVGMKRSRNDRDSADSQFFITFGPAKHLDGKYTVWGRVIHGIRNTARLKTGSPPHNPDRIRSMRLGTEVK